MVFNKIRDSFSVLREISFLGIAHFIPTIIAASFWFYIASLIGDEAYGETIYYLTIAGIGSTVTLLGTPTALNVYAAKG